MAKAEKKCKVDELISRIENYRFSEVNSIFEQSEFIVMLQLFGMDISHEKYSYEDIQRVFMALVSKFASQNIELFITEEERNAMMLKHFNVLKSVNMLNDDNVFDELEHFKDLI